MTDLRYLRTNLIDGFSQEVVQKLHFAIVGCGAVGNEVVKNLTLLGVGKLDVFDFDTIEIHNLTKSVLFRESDVGRKKAEVVAERAMELDPNVSVRAFVGDFWEKMSLDMLKGYNAVISCVDNFEARIRLNRLCALFSKDLVNTGIDSRNASIEVYPFSRNKECACYQCNLPNSVYAEISKRYSCGWLRNIAAQDKVIPTTPITASIAGAFAASIAIRLQNDAYEKSQQILIDSRTGTSLQLSFDLDEDCGGCSNRSASILHVKSSPDIDSRIFKLPRTFNKNIQITSSEPILTEFRCVNCTPDQKDVTIVFQNADSFTSTFSICKKCGQISRDIIIKDKFTISELLRKYKGFRFPCKYISTEINGTKLIIEMERDNEH